MSTRMSKTLKRLILVCLIAAAGFGAGRLSLFGAVERQQMVRHEPRCSLCMESTSELSFPTLGGRSRKSDDS